MRQMARDLRTSQKESEQRLGALLVQKIDDYLDSLTASDVVAGDPMRAAATIHEARKVWGQFRKGEIIGDTLHKAELRASQFSQSGPENAILTEFRQLARNDKLMRGFSKQERAAIERVAKGEPVVNVMRSLASSRHTAWCRRRSAAGPGTPWAGQAVLPQPWLQGRGRPPGGGRGDGGPRRSCPGHGVARRSAIRAAKRRPLGRSPCQRGSRCIARSAR